ncbi:MULTISPECIES: hypothetical protein [unclassified Schlesneria]|uniref:hypothetical protein n=1 Tax=unclassified Schlesneria TaxID=2762017 RepID=UPI002EF65C9B
MTNSNDLPNSTDSPSIPTSAKCNQCCPGVMKAVLYTPVILFAGALGAVAMFPDLADYGYPLIGKPSQTGFTGESACCAGDSYTCPVPAAGCSSQGISLELISAPDGACCPTGRSFAFPARPQASIETATSETAATATEESAPADADTPLNSTDETSLSN